MTGTGGFNITGNAGTATAFGATPSQCAAGIAFATGIAANGNANCVFLGQENWRAPIGNPDTVVENDAGNGILWGGSVNGAETLPTATTLGVPGFAFNIQNSITGLNTTVTINATSWLIYPNGGTSGGSSFVVAQGQTCFLFVSPGGGSWSTLCHEPQISSSGNITLTRSATGLTISGGGTVTSFSAADLSPLFTSSVATATSTPALTFSLSSAAQNSVFAGPATGGAGAPSYQTAPTIAVTNMTGTGGFNITGNAGTATALAATPSQCGGSNFSTGIAANGNANCAAPSGGGQAGVYTGVSFSATPTFTASSNTINAWTITLTGNVTSSTLASSAAGEYFAFKICQDGTGSHTFAWPTGFTAAVTIFPTASDCTEQAFFWDGTNAQPLAPAQVSGSTLSALWYGPTGSAPGTPPSGFLAAWFDSTDNALKVKNSSGTVTAAVGTGSCTNQVLTAISDSAAATCSTLTLASAYFANQGATTTLLHGNAAGNPSFSAVVLTTDVSGTLPAGNGGTNCSSPSISCFNNITGYTAAGETGTSSTNLVFSTSPVLTTPSVTTINDANGNPFIKSSATGSAVDSITVTNAATGTPATVTIGASGTDSGIGLTLKAADASLNGILGTVSLIGGSETGTGGSSSAAGGSSVQGGNNASTNASSQAGSIEIQPGHSTNGGLQGVGIYAQVMNVGGGTTTQWNLQCNTAVAMTVNDCGASPTSFVGVADFHSGSYSEIHVPPSETPINASAVVTLWDTVCAGSTGGKITDSGGTGPCPAGSGITVGRVIAVSGSWTFADGSASTITTSLPLVQMWKTNQIGNGDLASNINAATVGGFNLATPVAGGIGYGITTTQIGTTAALTQYGLVVSGGTGAPTSTLAGTTSTLLQGNAAGNPTWVSALPNGFTATTQTAAAADTKVATDAYADTNPLMNAQSSLSASQATGLYLPGSSLTVGAAYYESSGGLAEAEANASTTVPAVCLAVSTTRCGFSGVFKFSGSQSWTAGNIIYVSDASAGALVTTAPSTSGHYVQRFGVALANDTILIMPSLDVGGIQ